MTMVTTTSVPSRRFDRSSWLTVTFVLAFAAVCALVAALALREPGDGCLLDLNGDANAYACVGDWETPLRPGDRILIVGGQPIDNNKVMRGEDERLAVLASAATLPYTIERAGEALDLTVPLGRLDGWGILRAFAASSSYNGKGWLVYIFIGAAIIFGLAPRSRAAQLLLIACGAGAAVTTLAWAADSVGGNLLGPAPIYYSLVAVATFWEWLLVPTLLLLILSFPRRVWPLTRWPRATPFLIYGLPLVALAVSLLTGWVQIYLAALGLGALAFLTATIAVTVHTFWRGRDPVVRAQTAWLGLGLMVGVGIWPLLFVLGDYFPVLNAVPWLDAVLQITTSLSFILCLGIAITRYRLFDIEVVINRALVYALLTAVLAAVYFASVVLVEGAVRALTGQESDLAIVVATLAVAALFQPLRGRIQAFIDRRFFRRKYDAARILAAYGAALREGVELETLSAGLLRVADETMQPARVSLWLRATRGREEPELAASQPTRLVTRHR